MVVAALVVIAAAGVVIGCNCSFVCFVLSPVDRLRARFRQELTVNDAVKHCLDLITNSYGHYGTRQYDLFQWMTNGIIP